MSRTSWRSTLASLGIVGIIALTGCGGGSSHKAAPLDRSATTHTSAPATVNPTTAPTAAKPLVPATCSTPKLVITAPKPGTKVNGNTGVYIKGWVCLPGDDTLWGFDSTDADILNFDSPDTPGDIGPIEISNENLNWHDYQIGDAGVTNQPNTIILVSADPTCVHLLEQFSAKTDHNGDNVVQQSQLPNKHCQVMYTVTVEVSNN